jgi:UDP-N-acetylmuramoyl-L-alanyl-D-glutamate--2,6-diaminopimelate ligase
MSLHRTIPFRELLGGVRILASSGSNPGIEDVVYDSRRVRPGALFVAMRGGATDGNLYLDDALAQGAAAVVTDSAEAWERMRTAHPELALAKVEHGRRALAEISADFFDHPEAKMHLSGVTGTNGKTTTSFLLESILRSAGRRTVLVGTIEYRVGDEVRPSPHTTPGSRDLFELLADGLKAGAGEAVMEVSSHALDQERVWGLRWDVAVFTNLTQDHLDYHGDMESYFQAKAKMFTGVGTAPPHVAVIYIGDPYGKRLTAIARDAGCEVVTYALEEGDFHAADIRFGTHGMCFRMLSPAGEIELSTRLAGSMNVLNLLAASAAATARGLSLAEIAQGVKNARQVPGRFEAVDCGQPFTVVVDYAHTEDALRNLLKLARQWVHRPGQKSRRDGRVIVVFGCGGDRDRTKRPRMGRAAGEGSDFAVATSDNPRSEDPAAILAEILPGLETSGEKFIIEPDRTKAIRKAIAEARENDVVAIAGKGHEKVQILGSQKIPFDDVAFAREAILDRMSDSRTGGKTR